jgi:putative colanic acid biosysnthesis UDP-glucose lipid carrier transferase
MRRGLLKEHSNSLILLLRTLDIFIVLIASLIAYYIKFNHLEPNDSYIRAFILMCLISVIVFSSFSLYKSWRGASLINECYTLILAWTISFLLSLMVIFLFKAGIKFSREWSIELYFLGCLFFIFSRVFVRNILRLLRKRGYNQRSVCLVGSGDCGVRVFKHLTSVLKSGFKLQTIFTDTPENYPISKSMEELETWLELNSVDQIWIAIPFSKADKIKFVFHAARHIPVEIRLIPDIFAFRLLNHSLTDVDGLPILNLHSNPVGGTGNKLMKRLEDLILASFALLVLSPILALISFIIKLTSPGPILYKQTRIGLSNKPFQIMKFRSMPINIEKESGAIWAKAGENRATKFGSFLRKTSLDELPQFLNVLKGEMSVVGPRPERPEFIKNFKEQIPEYMKKHMVKAGITGWAQVNGWRGNTDLAKRIDYDLYYIENWSLLLDLKILLLTVIKGFINKNAY